MKQTSWSYVGPGRGGYEKVQQYNYVGTKQGSFQKEEAVPFEPMGGIRWQGCVVLAFMLVLLSLALYIFTPMVIPPVVTSTPAPSQELRTTSEPYDCTTDLKTCTSSWSLPRQKWCCDNYARGCPTMTTTRVPYDCRQGIVYTWALDKKAWCCDRYSIGCPTTSAPPAPASCDSICTYGGKAHSCRQRYQFAAAHQFLNQPNACESAKALVRSECAVCDSCRLRDSGCTTPAPTTPAPPLFNCNSGITTWEKTWSDEKKVFCCKNRGIACDPYDCNMDFSTWETSWCGKKKGWCCQNKRLGCPTTPAPAPSCGSYCTFGGESHSCRQRIQFAAAHQFAGQPSACESARSLVVSECGICAACPLSQAGCTTLAPTTLPPFDCNRNVALWEKGWSTAKKAWCCGHRGIACDPYDCQLDLPTWQTSWCTKKKGWCCQNRHLGCTTPSAPYDCNAGFADWNAGWSSTKKDWCCSHTGRGCPTTSSSIPYNCNVDSVSDWSEGKKVWCCRNVGRGCPTTSLPYDCDAGFAKWERGWSGGKKAWCCSHTGRGCTTTTTTCRYDCQAGLFHWSVAWSEDKKEWCCENEQLGCPEDAGR